MVVNYIDKFYRDRNKILRSSIFSTMSKLISEDELRGIELSEVSEYGLKVSKEFTDLLLVISKSMINEIRSKQSEE